MRNQLIASLLFVSFAGAANASEVTNSYSNEISTGTSNLQVHNIRSEVGTYNGIEKTLKMEATLGDVQTVNLTETANFTRTTNSHTVSAEN